MTTVARCLAKTGSLSPRVAAMQGLFQEFVLLCRGVFFDVSLDVGNDMGSVSLPSGLDVGVDMGGSVPLDGERGAEWGFGALTELED